MGTVALQWKGTGFLFLMNRDKSGFLEAEGVTIARNQRGRETLVASNRNKGDSIVTGVDANKVVLRGGSWFGFKKGRFAFVFDSSEPVSQYSTTLVPRFLESTMNPLEFAADLSEKEAALFGLELQLVVADINPNSQSMVYVSKRSVVDDTNFPIEIVLRGFHTISENGFDSSSPKDEDLRRNLTELINNDGEALRIFDIAENLMTKPPLFKDMIDASGDVVIPHTTQLIGLKVNGNTGQGDFYQWTAPPAI